jgi:hypothetical protein
VTAYAIFTTLITLTAEPNSSFPETTRDVIAVKANFCSQVTTGCNSLSSGCLAATLGYKLSCGFSHLSSLTVLSTGTATAFPFIVFWQLNDLSIFPSDYGSSLAAVLKAPFGSQTTTCSSASSTSTQIPSGTRNPSPRLSPGAQAGIGVGTGAVGIISVIAVIYLWRRRKHRRRRGVAHLAISEMEGGSNGLKRFMGGKWRAETDGTSEPVEESKNVRVIPGPPVELEATHRGTER